MDALTCRSPARCATCAHFDAAAGCALEDAIQVTLDAMDATRARPKPALFLMVDARRAQA